jgi:hypothetical protein
MMLRSRLALVLLLLISSVGFAATKDTAPPDREMLKMMELLREMEMIKQIDMLQDMHNIESANQAKNSTVQKSAPGKTKEVVK